MEEILIKNVMNVLVEWNPLGERAAKISDLNDYRTEAIDILFHINGMLKKDPVIAVKEILNEAFDLSLDNNDCIEAGNKIAIILKDMEKY